MGFFDDRMPDRLEPEIGLGVDDDEFVQPEWMGPPPDCVPGFSGQCGTIFETDDAGLWVNRFEVYPTGVEFTIELRTRRGTPRVDNGYHLIAGLMNGTPLSPHKMLWFGVESSDGSSWSNVRNLMGRYVHDHSAGPSAPSVWMNGGGGSTRHTNIRAWLWPLPAAGSLTFVGEWPERGISESTCVVDADEIRRAASVAHQVWASPPSIP